LRLCAREAVNHGPIRVRGLEGCFWPCVKKLPDRCGDCVTEHPDLFVVIAREASEGVRQELANDVCKTPGRWIRAGLGVFGGFLDLHEAAAVNTRVGPSQIKIILAEAPDPWCSKWSNNRSRITVAW
jgi:hypothetical protein